MKKVKLLTVFLVICLGVAVFAACDMSGLISPMPPDGSGNLGGVEDTKIEYSSNLYIPNEDNTDNNWGWWENNNGTWENISGNENTEYNGDKENSETEESSEPQDTVIEYTGNPCDGPHTYPESGATAICTVCGFVKAHDCYTYVWNEACQYCLGRGQTYNDYHECYENLGYYETAEPTCTEAGYRKGTYCRLCGKDQDLYWQEEIAALGHDWNESLQCNRCYEIANPTKDLRYALINNDREYEVYYIGGGTYEEIIIPSTYNGKPVTQISHKGFAGYSNITSVVIPSSIKTIAENAFESCTGLERVVIMNGVENISENAFYCCYALKGVTIPDSVKSIGACAFSNCPSLASITLGKSVEKISNNAFAWCYGVKEIIIPDSVKTIEHDAFAGCPIEKVIIGDNTQLESISSQAFNSCESLTYNIDDTNTETDTAYYLGNEKNPYLILIKARSQNIRTCDIHSSTKVIASNAFEYCDSLNQLNIPEYGITSIGDYAFYNCSSLTSIYLPQSLEMIGEYAFYDCSSLSSIYLPDGLLSIGKYAFYACSSLTELTVPDSVERIGERAFGDCNSLQSVVLPFLGDTRDGENAGYFKYVFENMYNSEVSSSLKVVQVNYATAIPESSFSNCYVNEIILPEGVRSIGEYAFAHCGQLKNINIPSTVESIGEYAFTGCAIESVTLPTSLKSIANYAFYDCGSLRTIKFSGTKDEWNAIDKGTVWDDCMPNYRVICNDGELLDTIPEVLEAMGGTPVRVSGTVEFIYNAWMDENMQVRVHAIIKDSEGNRLNIGSPLSLVSVGDVVIVDGCVSGYSDENRLQTGASVEIVGTEYVSIEYQTMTVEEVNSMDGMAYVAVSGTVSEFSSGSAHFMENYLTITDEYGNSVYISCYPEVVSVGDVITVCGVRLRGDSTIYTNMFVGYNFSKF